MPHPLIQTAEAASLKTDAALTGFTVGDDVDVYYKIVEGKKTRTQRFTGTVISINGRSVTKTFTVRRIVAGQGVERIFPYHSPNVESVTVKRSGKIRRAKLYFLRDRVGKATRLTEKADKFPKPKKSKKPVAA
jgi:large subunit ribosomal protein L19